MQYPLIRPLAVDILPHVLIILLKHCKDMACLKVVGWQLKESQVAIPGVEKDMIRFRIEKTKNKILIEIGDIILFALYLHL